MTERPMSDEALKLGLLMEAAQAQQRFSEQSLERLTAHTRNLEGTVREALRQTFIEALADLTQQVGRAEQSLQRLRRAANLRVLFWTVSITAVASLVALGEVWWTLPSPRELVRLRAQRDAMVVTLERLKHNGGLLQMRRCGAHARLCVRVDRKAPAFGANGDYRIVAGY